MRMNFKNILALKASLGIALFSAPGLAIDLAAHEATYEMSLLSANTEAQMTAIAGKTNFILRKDCEGWISSEDYLLEFAYETGDSAILASHFESWEELSGQLYSFEVDERSTFEEEKQFNGFATVTKAGKDRRGLFFDAAGCRFTPA